MTATRSTKTTAAKPAAKSRTKKATVPATRAEKAAATRAASTATDATLVCAVCAETLPVRRFPTSTKADGTIRRGATCRACAKARRPATA